MEVNGVGNLCEKLYGPQHIKLFFGKPVSSIKKKP